MAKADQAKYLKNINKDRYPYESQFGSHVSMVNEEATKALDDPTLVVCTDQFGDYVTFKVNLDNHLADPNRNAHSRFEKFCKSKRSEDN